MWLVMRKSAELMFGESQEGAVKRLNRIWSVLEKNQIVWGWGLYREFVEGCELLGYTKEVSLGNSKDISYFIPHHAVCRPDEYPSHYALFLMRAGMPQADGL